MVSVMSVRPPRVRAYSFSPSTCHIYYLMFRVVIGLQFVVQPYPHLVALCDFCSSGQRFAYTFLQIPPHDGHPWRSAMTFPLLGGLGTFTHENTPMPGAHKKGSPCKETSFFYVSYIRLTAYCEPPTNQNL